MRQGRVSGTAKGLALAAVAAVASGLHAPKLAYLFALPATLLFAWGSLSQFDLPALYFDAVNPDYLVLRLISTPKNTPVSLVPGNLVLNVFPVLIQIYHGALPFYLGAPFYLLFGTGMFGVRVAHGAFGLAVIAALAFAMRAMKMNPVVAGFALVALALDPGFVYAFRTQFYITVLPLALVFIALGLSVQSNARGRNCRLVRRSFDLWLFLFPVRRAGAVLDGVARVAAGAASALTARNG